MEEWEHFFTMALRSHFQHSGHRGYQKLMNKEIFKKASSP